MMFKSGQDIAIDLGTANTLVYIKGEGIVLNDASVIALDTATGKTLAVGQAAKDMFGRVSGTVKCIRPIKDGVIADFETTAAMLKSFTAPLIKKGLFSKPRFTITVPSNITLVEKKAVVDAARYAGTHHIQLVEEPFAAALGAGLTVSDNIGQMIVDIGGGTTEIAIFYGGKTIYSKSLRVAGDVMDEAVQRCIMRRYGLQIGINEAERLKIALGSAFCPHADLSAAAFGRSQIRCMPQKSEVKARDLFDALKDPISGIITAIMSALERTSPNIIKDILTNGIYLVGGGALLKGLSDKLKQELEITIKTVPDPLTCVAQGLGKIVEDPKLIGTINESLVVTN